MRSHPPVKIASANLRVHVAALDGVRGLAVLVVFLFHYGGGAQSGNRVVHAMGVLDQLGWSGVTLFFVLSGFLITGVLWRSKGLEHWWRTFMVRRSARIFPLYFLCLLVVLAQAATHGTLVAGWHRVVLYAFYLQNFFSDISMKDVTPLRLSHFWSLAVEEQFYLVWPFVMMKMPSLRRARQFCVLTFVASLAFRIAVMGSHATWLLHATPARAGELAVGGWLALTLMERPELMAVLRRWSVAAVAAGLAVALGCAAMAHEMKLETAPMYIAGLVGLSLSSAGLVVLALGENRVSRMLRFRPLRHLGTISYGVYVYHVFLGSFFLDIAKLIAPHGGHNGLLVLRFLTAAAVTLVVAEVSFHFVEKPILALRGGVAVPQPKVFEVASQPAA